MANVGIVGKFTYEDTDLVFTIMKFFPSEPSETKEFFITDGLEFVEPLVGQKIFMDRRGNCLIAV